jgi:hypothetical protein
LKNGRQKADFMMFELLWIQSLESQKRLIVCELFLPFSRVEGNIKVANLSDQIPK